MKRQPRQALLFSIPPMKWPIIPIMVSISRVHLHIWAIALFYTTLLRHLSDQLQVVSKRSMFPPMVFNSRSGVKLHYYQVNMIHSAATLHSQHLFILRRWSMVPRTKSPLVLLYRMSPDSHSHSIVP